MPASKRWPLPHAALGGPECCRGALWWLPIARGLACDTCGVEVEPAEIDGADA